MDHMKILSRAFRITWQHKALWLFGFLFVLAGGSSSGFRGSGSPGSGSGYQVNGNDFGPGGINWQPPDWPTIAIIIGVAVVVILLLAVLFTILRYVAETAIIAGVDEIESTEAKFTARRGFKLGWSRQALWLFLTDLIIGIPVAIVSILLLLLACAPFLVWATNAPEGIKAIVTLIGVGLVLLVVLCIIVIALVISVIEPYIKRRIVLAKQDAFTAIRQGVQLVRASMLDTGVTWLILVGVGILWGIIMIPVALVLLALIGAIGLIPAGLIYAVSQSWIVAAIVGGGLFILILTPVLSFIQGLYEVYISGVWTLAYREVASKYSALFSAAPASA